ncbi:MAG: SMC-Scp complex subunit ScpB [Verrucomicrobia bacterium]|nr:SMC-Scp complex subunit ScpB [Verrucomicrobiota bacterium]
MTPTIKHAVEALVFASPKPITAGEIVKAIRAGAVETEILTLNPLTETKEAEVLAALAELKADYEQQERAFQLTEQINGWAMTTVKDVADFVRQLYPEAKPTRLSGPALETLAIIAYRQPVTRADIEAVRGVAVDGVMQVLLDRSLVTITGRAEVPGRPLLYATTEYFLQHFGLKDVDELPNADELRRVVLPKAEIPAEEKSVEAAADAAATTEGMHAAPGDAAHEAAHEAPAETEDEPAHVEQAEQTGHAGEEIAELELQAETAEVEPGDATPASEI